MDARQAALTRLVSQQFDPVPRGIVASVGVEIELFPLRFTRFGTLAVAMEELRHMLASAGILSAEGNISFEPGGQLELSPTPDTSVEALLGRIRGLLGRLGTLGAGHGVSFMAEGVNRWLTADEIGLQKDTERYREMQRHFDAIGPAGRQMMRRTASLQVCLDLLPGTAGAEQWRLLNLCGPALAAAFTNQPQLARLRDASVESRSRIWQATDPSRTGFEGRQLGEYPVSAYRDFALQAEVIPLDDGQSEASPCRATLDEWIACGHERPTPADLAHHLTTLFAPVRPRGRYLEVRYLDALPLPWLSVPVCLLATLVSSSGARRAALRRLRAETAPIGEQWRRSARYGPGDATLRADAEALFELALAHLDDLPADYLPADAASLLRNYRERFLSVGRSPADDSAEVEGVREEAEPCALR